MSSPILAGLLVKEVSKSEENLYCPHYIEIDPAAEKAEETQTSELSQRLFRDLYLEP